MNAFRSWTKRLTSSEAGGRRTAAPCAGAASFTTYKLQQRTTSSSPPPCTTQAHEAELWILLSSRAAISAAPLLQAGRFSPGFSRLRPLTLTTVAAKCGHERRRIPEHKCIPNGYRYKNNSSSSSLLSFRNAICSLCLHSHDWEKRQSPRERENRQDEEEERAQRTTA